MVEILCSLWIHLNCIFFLCKWWDFTTWFLKVFSGSHCIGVKQLVAFHCDVERAFQVESDLNRSTTAWKCHSQSLSGGAIVVWHRIYTWHRGSDRAVGIDWRVGGSQVLTSRVHQWPGKGHLKTCESRNVESGE